MLLKGLKCQANVRDLKQHMVEAVEDCLLDNTELVHCIEVDQESIGPRGRPRDLPQVSIIHLDRNCSG